MLKKILIYFRAHTERRQLLRLALILSPLMAIFRVAPILIFNELDIKGRLPDFINQNVGIWLAILFVATSIFIQWIINIWLLTKPEKGEQSNRLLYKRYAWSYLLSISLLLFPNILIQVLDLPIVNNPPFSIFPFIGMVANNTAILLIVNLIITRNKKSQLELKNMQLEMNNLMAQQEQLKHQLHPHFLFNALYTLQLLIKKQPQQAEEYLNRLSTFLRTSIQHAKENKLSIKEELDFCLDYLALQKVRFGEALQYEINLPKSVSAHAALPIFTLQSLAENA
ncbi:MAG: histidine kinase, partial [Bacteroidota bacterium]